MSLEEQVRYHEQCIRSIESNLDRVTASQAETSQSLAAVTEALAVVAQNQSAFAAAFASLTRRVDDLAEENRRLAAAVERFIRFRGNGEPRK